ASADLLAELLELAQVLEIERIGRADRERDAVQHDRIALGDLRQDVARTAERIDVVLADHLEPVDGRLVAQDVLEVGGPQSDAETEVVMAEAGLHALLSGLESGDAGNDVPDARRFHPGARQPANESTCRSRWAPGRTSCPPCSSPPRSWRAPPSTCRP